MSARLIDNFATTAALAAVFSDDAVLRAMLRFEAALAQSQARLGMIPREAAEAIAKIEGIDCGALAVDARRSASLAVPFVKALRERAGDASLYVHWGATSQDVLDTALVLLLRDAREILEADGRRFERSLRALSDRHAGTLMTARTLLQPAQATTFGYKVAGWYAAVRRSGRDVSRAFDEALQLQLGGAAGTLAAYGGRGLELARELANELQLAESRAPWHGQRDRLAALVAHCGIYAGSLAKIARDVALLMQAEVGEVSEPGGESSAMAHKRNPAGSVVVLAAAARLPGLVAAFLGSMSGEHERAAGGWQSEWPIVADAVQSTGSALAAAADVVENLTVNPERMRTNLAQANLPGSDPGAAETLRRRILEDTE